jgi:hypothetical protein
MKYIIPSIVIFITSCVPITPTSSTSELALEYDDTNYDDNVGMVQLFPTSDIIGAETKYPAISITDQGLTLDFDLLEENSANLYIKYIHCNADWSPSRAPDLQFLRVYNEFTIDNYQYSENTKTPYVSYSTALPTPNLSGNYLLIVYRDSDPNNLVLSRRFLVYEQRAQITAKVSRTSSVSLRNTHQQINFSVEYQLSETPNPLKDFKVVILQNHNWNTKIEGLQPTQIKQFQGALSYDLFSEENSLAGINEFRFFDIRSIDYRGMNVAYIQKDPTVINAFLGTDKSRKGLAYSQLNEDLNGGYYLINHDPDDSQLQSEYVKVHFNLTHPEIDSAVYVVGSWNNWKLEESNKLYYNYDSESYVGNCLLKQGYYDYFYWVNGTKLPFYLLEGSHFETTNNYEVLFYYRNPINNFDELIGYQSLTSGYK